MGVEYYVVRDIITCYNLQDNRNVIAPGMVHRYFFRPHFTRLGSLDYCSLDRDIIK